MGAIVLLVGAFLAAGLTGCHKTSKGNDEIQEVSPSDTDPSDKPKEGPRPRRPRLQVHELELELPESSAAPSYAPDRVSHLTIGGKDFSEPRETTRSIKVKLPVGKKRVKVEYSYWPNTYTNIIRGRQVTLTVGKKTSIDLTKKEEGDSELIKPIYVPTPVEVVEKMCEMAKIRKGDVVYDIGCGDGRLVIMAVKKFGAKKGVGIDINADLIKKCKDNAKEAGVSGKTDFKNANALEIKDWSEANVVLLYLGDFLNEALRPSLQKTLRPGSRVVSHRFLMGDWKPDRSIMIKAKNSSDELEDYKLHLWTIPKGKP